MDVEELEVNDDMVHLAYPDPSAIGAPVTFDLTRFQRGERLLVRIMDASGRLLVELDLSAMSGTTWIWDGLDTQGRTLQGQLIYQLITSTVILAGRLTRL